MIPESNIQYTDGVQTVPVRVLVFNHRLHLYTTATDSLLRSEELKRCTIETKDTLQYLYLHGPTGPCIFYNSDIPFATLISDELKNYSGSRINQLINKKMLLITGFILLLLAGVWLLLLYLLPWLGMRVITAEQEQVIGDNICQSVVLHQPENTGLSQLVQAYAGELQLSKNYHIRTIVISSPEINAFALPGGTVVLYTGLLDHMQTSEELAALLSHEASHINGRHSLRALLKETSLATLAGWISSGSSALTAMVIRNAMDVKKLSYSRTLEREADAQGMQLLAYNRVSPQAMVLLLQHLQQAEQTIAVALLGTHPLTQQRIQAAQLFVQNNGNSMYTTNASLQNLWHYIKSK